MTELDKLAALRADLWVFDNDGTLYNDTSIQLAVARQMDMFFARMHGIEECRGKAIREKLKKKHSVSSTLVALHREGCPVDAFIQETYLTVNFYAEDICSPTILATFVPHLSGEKIILTNSPSEFVRKVLVNLGLEGQFSRIYGIRELNYYLKPATEAFTPLISAVQEGKRVVYIDDKIQNLLAVKDADLVTKLWWNGTGLVKIGGTCETI